jgi:hypothetical protein
LAIASTFNAGMVVRGHGPYNNSGMKLHHVTWDVVHGTKEQMIASKKYEYRLEDFLCNIEKATEFSGILSHLPALLND